MHQVNDFDINLKDGHAPNNCFSMKNIRQINNEHNKAYRLPYYFDNMPLVHLTHDFENKINQIQQISFTYQI